MVKKPQAKGGKPGGGGGAKKPSPATTTGDDSFIVFSNSDKDPKLRTPVGSSATGLSNLPGPASAGDAPKKSDVKKLIGGASWTGKLPVNMLSEHCQKQKWEKPEYTMVSLCYSLTSVTDMDLLCAVKNIRRLLIYGYRQIEKSENSRARYSCTIQAPFLSQASCQ